MTVLPLRPLVLAYMEHTAAWGGPFEFQLAPTNCTAEEGPAGDDAQAWPAPAAGHPSEYASIVDIFGSSCSLQPFVVPASSSSSGGQQQLVEYNYYNHYAAAAQHDDPDLMETYMNNPEKLFQEITMEFKDDAQLMKTKMHRYPPNIQALGDWCTVPNVVAIGPYFHRRDHLQKTEKIKHVAARYCIQGYKAVNNNSGLSVQDMYAAVVSVAAEIDARSLYDKDVMEGLGYEDDFLPMMFYDACFLVMYMLQKSGMELDATLYDFFESKDNDIAHDIMLLENQIPWPVVDAVMSNCTAEPLGRLKMFIAHCKDGFLQDRVIPRLPHVDWDEYYKAPHLLGLLRFYVLGSSRSGPMVLASVSKKRNPIQTEMKISPSATELAEMGIFLKANETAKLPDMTLAKKWIIFAEFPMVPLSFSDLRASRLVNMAALELCTTSDFFEAGREDSAVCSYLLLLCMLLHREKDVDELRRKGILQGVGRTTDKTLDFFTSFQNLPRGRSYAELMVQIEGYRTVRTTRWWWRLYKFVYKNRKIIAGILSAVGTVVSIIVTLKTAH